MLGGHGSPRVSRKVLGPLGQELCGPLQLLQAGTCQGISLRLLLLTGGAGVCTGSGGQSEPGEGSLRKTCPASLSPEGRSSFPRAHPWPTSRPCSPPSWSLGSPGAPAPSMGKLLVAAGSFLFTFAFFCLNSCKSHSRSQSQGSSLYLQSQSTRAGLRPSRKPGLSARPLPGSCLPTAWLPLSGEQLAGVIGQVHQRLLHLPLELLIGVLRLLQVTFPVLVDRQVGDTHL